MRNCNSPCILACSSFSVRSACLAIQSRNCFRTSGVNLLRGPRGPAGGRSIRPVRPNVIDIRRAQLSLTRNRPANFLRLPSPCWCASNNLRRKSSE